MNLFQKKETMKVTPIDTNKRVKKERMNKLIASLGAIGFLFMGNTMPVMAANLAENAANVIFINLFWIGLIGLAIVILKCVIARNFVAAVISGIGGGVLLVFIQKPKILADLGETIWLLINKA